MGPSPGYKVAAGEQFILVLLILRSVVLKQK